MENCSFDIRVEMSVSIPIIGDESIMLLQPPNGFVFKRYLFDDYKFKSKLIDGSSKVKEDYYFAVHGDSEKYLVCLELEDTIICNQDKPVGLLSFLTGNDFESLTEPIHQDLGSRLWRYFAMLHLFKEGEIALKHAFYTYQTTEGILTNKINREIVYADIVTLIRYPMIISQNEIASINAFMISHDQSFNMLKQDVIDTLEYTYHVLDDVTNFKNITTPLEVLFLKKDEKGKKVSLSNRIAVFLGSNDLETTNIYNRVRQLYSVRGAATHEGKSLQITRATLDELRNLLRHVTKKYMLLIERKIALNPTIDFRTIKQELIADLQKEVAIKKAAGVLP
jgi:hypothetical protein